MGALGGRCPRCLMEAGLPSEVDAQRTMTVAPSAGAGPVGPGIPAPPTIARYKIVRLIGEGGMGAVYLAERSDQQYEKSVAIKIAPVSLVRSQLF